MFVKSLFLATSALIGSLAANPIPLPLDSLLDIPKNWQMTPEAFEKRFKAGNTKLYTWLTKDRTRAKISRNLYGRDRIALSLFDGKVQAQEAIVDFADGKLNLITVSIYNRADSGPITAEDFVAKFTATGKAMGEIIGTAPRRREADLNSGLLTEGYSWYSQDSGIALLEHNDGAREEADREFLRLRVARPKASGSLAKSMTHTRGGAATRLSDLPENVRKNENGDVFISGLPMVDQGDKGYCVVASAQRVFEYIGIGADMHQIAEISEADPRRGTSTMAMAKELDKIDYRFKTRLDIIGMGMPLREIDVRRGEYYTGDRVDERKFLKEIRSHIDSGLPLLWSLQLGYFPEKPQLSPQTSGGHMRMIIGYNDTSEEIIFSDSWGAGHESKKMKMSHAYKASHGLFVLKPTVH